MSGSGLPGVITPSTVGVMTPTDQREPYRCPDCRRELKTVAGFRRHLERHIRDLDPQVFPRGREAWLLEHGYTVPWMDRP